MSFCFYTVSRLNNENGHVTKIVSVYGKQMAHDQS